MSRAAAKGATVLFDAKIVAVEVVLPLGVNDDLAPRRDRLGFQGFDGSGRIHLRRQDTA